MNTLKIACNSMPLVAEADYGFVQKPYAHCDRTAPFNVLIYLIKGEMEIYEDGIPYTLTPNTAFLLKNSVHHWGEKPFSIGTAWYYVHFYAQDSSYPEIQTTSKPVERLNISPDEYNRSIEIPKIIHLPHNSLEDKFSQVADYHNSHNIMKSSLALWDILLTLSGIEKQKNTYTDSRTDKLSAFIEKHYNEEITAAKIERISGLTAKYIGSVFKENTGFSIHEYQIMLRIKQAKKMLCETEMSIAEIADAVGFYDAFYFSRIFKRETHISPREYRNNYEPRI